MTDTDTDPALLRRTIELAPQSRARGDHPFGAPPPGHSAFLQTGFFARWLFSEHWLFEALAL